MSTENSNEMNFIPPVKNHISDHLRSPQLLEPKSDLIQSLSNALSNIGGECVDPMKSGEEPQSVKTQNEILKALERVAESIAR